MKYLYFFFLVGLTIFMRFGEGRIEIDIYKQKPMSISRQRRDIHPSGKPWKNDSVVLYKFLNGEYYGLIGVGSPSKTFKVVFDTTWADIWLPSSHCSWTEIICKLHTQYDSSKSSSYIANGTFVSMKSKDLSLKGVLSTDIFRLAHVKVENQTFMEATHMSFDPFWQYTADGVIGLAYQEQSGWPGVLPFFYNLVRQQVVTENVFTFYMNRDETTEKAGKVIFGGTQRENIKNGTLTELQVVEKRFWMVQMDGIYSETNKTLRKITGSSRAIFDSSANTIVGPPNEIEALNWMLNAQYVPGLNRYTVNCRQYAKLPLVHFVLNDKNFTIQSKYYVQHFVLANVEACFSPFVPSTNPNQNFWELGGAFMMEFYTEFDMDNNIVNIAQTIF